MTSHPQPDPKSAGPRPTDTPLRVEAGTGSSHRLAAGECCAPSSGPAVTAAASESLAPKAGVSVSAQIGGAEPDSGLRVREGRRAGRFTLPATPLPPAFAALNEAINRRAR